MNASKRKIVAAVVVLIAVAAAGTFYHRYRASEKAAADELILYGNIDIRQVNLAFFDQDRIAEMYVVEGERVKRRQLLATLDTRERKLDLNRAEAELVKAREDLKFADVHLRDIVAARKKTPGAVSKLQEDETRAARNALRALVDSNQAKLALAEKKLTDAYLYAPADAVVQTRVLEPGDMASPQLTVYTLALIDPMWARVYVDEPDIGRIREGARAYITSDSYPGKRYSGWVGFISPVAEFTPKTVETTEVRTDLVYQARIYVCNPENELRLGMPVTAHIPFDQPGELVTQATACPAK
jgi:HlyD family secretion protein